MAEYIKKFAVVDKLTELQNELQQYKPFRPCEATMYRRICDVEIEIGKMAAEDVVPRHKLQAEVDREVSDLTSALEVERRKVKRLEEELRKAESEREYFRSRAAFFAVEAGANGKVINVEGYKAFRGTMRISPKGAEAYELCGNWLYKPGTGCWYGNGRSFPKEVCTILERKE